ncbi:MAG: RNA methyltransferase [Alphaproteobacteria bacterium]|nr:MAG: RNA methyltransferase [Alphaproteobacteria bacterium]
MKIYGKHAALEALKNPKRKILDVFVEKPDIVPSHVKAYVTNINKKFPELHNHQGIVVITKPLPTRDLEDVEGKILILDQITDPQNLGAIIRSCAVFGIKFLIVQDFQGLLDSHVMARIASGGLEHVSIIPVINITDTVKKLKDKGYWVYGLSEKGSDALSQTKFDEKAAIIIGAEGKGIRPLVLKNCDFLVKIDTSPDFSTLNASHATSIVLYEVTK